MACRHAPTDLPVCCNRADRRSGTTGFEAVWLRARIYIPSPLCHQVRQFGRHNALGVLSGAAAVSACNADFTAHRFMVRDNGMDGSREF